MFVVRQEKGTQTQTLGCGYWWGGDLPCDGVGAKKFGMSLETRETKLVWRDIPGFCWDIPVVPEKLEKKSLCSVFGPYKEIILFEGLLIEIQEEVHHFERQGFKGHQNREQIFCEQSGVSLFWQKWDLLKILSRLSRLLRDSFPDSRGGSRGWRAREMVFSRFFGVSGPKGPRDSCRW